METLDVLSINIESVGLPLQCLGLGSYEYSLAFKMFVPIVVAAAVVLGFLLAPLTQGVAARDPRWFRRGRPKEQLLAALPWLLLLSFLVFPMVPSAADPNLGP